MTRQDQYLDPYGLWEVYTGEYGRGWEVIGTYYGYIDEIAFGLADKCNESLRFRKIELGPPVPKIAQNTVRISFEHDSGTWDMNPEALVQYFRGVLRSRRGISIDQSSESHAVVLNNLDVDGLKRRVALAKLTDEEKELLGLVPATRLSTGESNF